MRTVHILNKKGVYYLCGISTEGAALSDFAIWVDRNYDWSDPKPTCETCILLNWTNPINTYVSNIK